jgi:hypothetical protein
MPAKPRAVIVLALRLVMAAVGAFVVAAPPS